MTPYEQKRQDTLEWAANNLLRQRDALLAACKEILPLCEHRWRAMPADTPEKNAINAVKAAIAASEQAGAA